mmetsp:Transcript_31219/g.85648  ORF Transcript_31219/g.85648 Transcript_31219/m.85648 type:complete len:262 (-) Transcript_31219:23-808(-)
MLTIEPRQKVLALDLSRCHALKTWKPRFAEKSLLCFWSPPSHAAMDTCLLEPRLTGHRDEVDIRIADLEILGRTSLGTISALSEGTSRVSRLDPLTNTFGASELGGATTSEGGSAGIPGRLPTELSSDFASPLLKSSSCRSCLFVDSCSRSTEFCDSRKVTREVSLCTNRVWWSKMEASSEAMSEATSCLKLIVRLLSSPRPGVSHASSAESSGPAPGEVTNTVGGQSSSTEEFRLSLSYDVCELKLIPAWTCRVHFGAAP